MAKIESTGNPKNQLMPTGTLTHCSEECRMIQHLGRVCQFLIIPQRNEADIMYKPIHTAVHSSSIILSRNWKLPKISSKVIQANFRTSTQWRT
jgi:hypothetical protein